MALQANAAGVVAGRFTVPAGIPAGVKRVVFDGAGGSHGEAQYVGENEIIRRTMQTVTTVTESRFTQAVRNSDPLAQTFTLAEACQIGGVDLWFTAKGSSDILVQIRETQAGFPGRTVLAEARVEPGDVVTGGPHTRIAFPWPVSLSAGVEYALVALCDDADAALAIAELGKWDAANSRWVTGQPYQVGVLLSSSNASTWTAHQDRDLAFRLLKAVFSTTERTVSLGGASVSGATDLMLLALAQEPTAQARAELRLTLPGGSVVAVSDGQPVRLAEPVTGSVGVSARLTGDQNASPVLLPGAQLVSGQAAASADYVTRAIPAGTGSRALVIFDALIPGGASVGVQAAGIDPGDAWTAVPYQSSTPIGEGWHELVHELAGVDESAVRVKLTLAGTSAARPRVRNLRVLVLE